MDPANTAQDIIPFSALNIQVGLALQGRDLFLRRSDLGLLVFHVDITHLIIVVLVVILFVFIVKHAALALLVIVLVVVDLESNGDSLLLATESLGLLALGLHLLDILLGQAQLAQALLLAAAHAGQEVLVLSDELAGGGKLTLTLASHALLVEDALATLTDLGHALHGLEGLAHELSVVADGNVAAGGELQSRVDRHLLAGGLTEGLCPLELARVSLHLELWR
ncbi:hypothetical protein HG531_011492 [Fusarium graminearum]|nr:hypothetical protein HG531_011492 [Fusarium graminearum]